MLHPCLAGADWAGAAGGAGPDVVVRPGTRPCSSGVGPGQGTSRQRAPPMPLRLAQLGVFPTCWLLRLLRLDSPHQGQTKAPRYQLRHTAARLIRGQRKRKIRIPNT